MSTEVAIAASPDEPVILPAPAATELSEVELLRLQVERLTRENEAHHQRNQRTIEIVNEIDQAEALYEAAKSEAKKHKEELTASKASLRALVAGDVQVEVNFDETDDGAHQPGPTESLVSHRGDHRTVSAVHSVAQFALTAKALDDCDTAAVDPLEPSLSDRKVSAINAGPMAYLPLEQRVFADGSGYFDCWPLVDADSWSINYGARFAHALTDVQDEAPDIVARRKLGGELCGVTVKVKGQRKRRSVIGPDSEVARFLYGPEGGALTDACEAARFLPDGLKVDQANEVLAFPDHELADRIEARLREYSPTAAGFHEGLTLALAGDLKADESDVVRAVQDDGARARFDLMLMSANGKSEQVVRLLTVSPAVD